MILLEITVEFIGKAVNVEVDRVASNNIRERLIYLPSSIHANANQPHNKYYSPHKPFFHPYIYTYIFNI